MNWDLYTGNATGVSVTRDIVTTLARFFGIDITKLWRLSSNIGSLVSRVYNGNFTWSTALSVARDIVGVVWDLIPASKLFKVPEAVVSIAGLL